MLFKYNLSDAKGYFIKLGASGNLYYYGFLSGIVNTYYRKVTPIDATIWERIYTFKTSTYGFDLDSAETYMYTMVMDTTALIIVQMSTNDGSITSQVKTTSLKYSSYSSLSISSDSSTM